MSAALFVNRVYRLCSLQLRCKNATHDPMIMQLARPDIRPGNRYWDVIWSVHSADIDTTSPGVVRTKTSKY